MGKGRGENDIDSQHCWYFSPIPERLISSLSLSLFLSSSLPRSRPYTDRRKKERPHATLRRRRNSFGENLSIARHEETSVAGGKPREKEEAAEKRRLDAQRNQVEENRDRHRTEGSTKVSSGGIASRLLPSGSSNENASSRRDAIESATSNVISHVRSLEHVVLVDRRFGEAKEAGRETRARAKSLSTGNKAERDIPEEDVAEFHLTSGGGQKTTARSRFSASSPHPIDADGPAATDAFPASSRSGASHTLEHPRTGARTRVHGEKSVYAVRTARRTGRTYSPPRHLAANTPKPSHRPYLHPRRSLEAESPAIFYTREHILHCDVKRSASSRKAQATPASASAVSVVGRLVGTSCDGGTGFSCIFGSTAR